MLFKYNSRNNFEKKIKVDLFIKLNMKNIYVVIFRKFIWFKNLTQSLLLGPVIFIKWRKH